MSSEYHSRQGRSCVVTLHACQWRGNAESGEHHHHGDKNKHVVKWLLFG